MIKAGISEVNITPPVGVSMCGFAARGGPSEAIHDELYARVLVLDDGKTQVAIVGADVISFAPDLVSGIREMVEHSVGIPGGHILLNGFSFPFGSLCDGFSMYGRPRCSL